MTARINDDRIAVAHQDVTERGFADAIELDDVRKGGGGRQSAGDVDGLPGGHSADDGIGLVAALAQKRRRLLAGVTVTADDRDRSRRVKPKRSDVIAPNWSASVFVAGSPRLVLCAIMVYAISNRPSSPVSSGKR